MAETLLNIDDHRLLSVLRLKLNEELQQVAKPIVEKHLAAASAELSEALRKRTGQLLVGLIDQNMSMYRRENQLVITLNQAVGDRHG